MIELFADRVKISYPGTPPIKVERFIDEYRSRNKRLADLMRRLGICEKKGSRVHMASHASQVIGAAKETGFIKADESETTFTGNRPVAQVATA